MSTLGRKGLGPGTFMAPPEPPSGSPPAPPGLMKKLLLGYRYAGPEDRHHGLLS